MVGLEVDQDEFSRVMKDTKEGGPREAGRYLASEVAKGMALEAFKDLAASGEMPGEVSDWLSGIELPKGAMKQIRNGFKSRISELLDSLDRSRSWEGFTGLSEAARWTEVRKG